MKLPRGVRKVFPTGRGTTDRNELIDLELRHHVDMVTAQLVEQGYAPDDARRMALERVGDLAAYRSACVAESMRTGIAGTGP